MVGVHRDVRGRMGVVGVVRGGVGVVRVHRDVRGGMGMVGLIRVG